MTKRVVLDCTVPLVDVQVQQQNLPGGRHRLGEKATRHVWNACRCQEVLRWLLLLGKSTYKLTTSFDFLGAYSRNSLCLDSVSAAVSTSFTISVQGAKLKVQKGESGWQHCKQQNAHFCQHVLLHCTLGCFASVDCSWQKGVRSVVLSVWYWTVARQWRRRPVNGRWAHSLSSTVMAYVVLYVSPY